MTNPSPSPVTILDRLVRFRTDLTGGHERPLADHLAEELRRFSPDEVLIEDVPRSDGAKAASWVFARFGTPRLLVNAHIDTVPPNADWSSDPFVPRIEGDRLYALGAADTKGAIAAILAALEDGVPKDTGILFSGDEEWSGVAVRHFVGTSHRAGIERAFVCEPTNLALGTRHRGFCAFDATVSGPGGHSSKADDMPSPIGRLARLAVALDDWAVRHKTVGPPGFPGMCVNLAKLDGGVAFNVIPAEAKLVVSLRPPPGADTNALRGELEALATSIAPDAALHFLRANAPFATRDLAAFARLGCEEVARKPLDLGFWTEAAVLAESGIDAVVMGPGDIAQAHAPNEWVDVRELAAAADRFRAIFRATRAS